MLNVCYFFNRIFPDQTSISMSEMASLLFLWLSNFWHSMFYSVLYKSNIYRLEEDFFSVPEEVDICEIKNLLLLKFLLKLKTPLLMCIFKIVCLYEYPSNRTSMDLGLTCVQGVCFNIQFTISTSGIWLLVSVSEDVLFPWILCMPVFTPLYLVILSGLCVSDWHWVFV